MRNPLLIAAAAVLVACEAATGDGGQPGVLDHMFLYNAESSFKAGDTYVFADHWRAYDGLGQEMPLDSIRLGYSLGDSVTAEAEASGSFTLEEPFIGFLYVFGPTVRAPMERLGRHYISVRDSTGP